MAASSNPHVIVLSIAQFLWGGAVALGGLAFMLMGAFMGAVLAEFFSEVFGTWFGGVASAGIALFILIGLMIAAVGAFVIVSGVGLLRGHPWGRITTFITAGLAGLSALQGIVSLASGGMELDWILAAAYAVYAFVMLTRAEIAALYTGRAPVMRAA